MSTPSTVLNLKVESQNITDSFPPENAAANITKSVNELGSLASAIQAFKNRYEELQNHLDFITQAIDEESKEITASLCLNQGTVTTTATDGDVAVQTVTENDGKSLGSANIPNSNASENENKIFKDGVENENENESEIVTLCKTMDSRGFRRYILMRIPDDEAALREQVPEALKRSPDPARLVFESIGRFYVSGLKAYMKTPHMVRARQASVLVLEYYLMSGCVESDKEAEKSLKKEVSLAAFEWRNRMVAEGGVAMAVEIDARGLLLLIIGFGISNLFTNEDVLNLVRLSNPGKISQALRKSQALHKRVSVMAEGLMKRGMAVELVDLAYTFGFEEKYSIQAILSSFLQKSADAWRKTKVKQESHDIPSVLKEANEKYLNALKSVVKCLEGHRIDLETLLPGWHLKDKIINLEKDISNINKKITEKVVPKRKMEKNNSPKKVNIPKDKRSRLHEKDPYVASPSVDALQEQRIASHIDGNTSYDDLLVARYLDGRSYGYSKYFPTASSAQIGSVSGSLPESYLGGTVADMGNMHGTGMSAPAISAGFGAAIGSYSEYQGDMMIDNIGTRPNSNSHMYYSRLHGIGEGSLVSDERSAGLSLGGHQTAARVNDLYRRTSTDAISGYPDHPSMGHASRSGGSDLYSFADSVFDR
ncbi:hypothetical protein Lal_00001903 [Lupinus albus]|uniref:FRIGIDA-like protein n=1 Tax=Lupinus albus TaxID=3870 RepID=A0A6A5P9T5_LUPAL|nr:hypothetical protein Lalb_Chr11g0068951 [Lupinus albus]KAF1893429.1 hypothetical protein Lal_00001903 [Lupinus albus]